MSIVHQLFNIKITPTARADMTRMFGGTKMFSQERQNTTEYHGKNDGSITSAVADATGQMCIFGNSVEERETFATNHQTTEFKHVADTLRDHGLAVVFITQEFVEWESKICDRMVFCESVAGVIIEDEPDMFSSIRFFTDNCPLFIHRSFSPVVLDTAQFWFFMDGFHAKSYALVKFDSPLAHRLEILAPVRFTPFQSIPSPPYDKYLKPLSPNQKSARTKRKRLEHEVGKPEMSVGRPLEVSPQSSAFMPYPKPSVVFPVQAPVQVQLLRVKLEADLHFHMQSVQMIQSMIQDLGEY